MSLKLKDFLRFFKSKKSQYPKKILERAYNNTHISFSQDGEDIALGRMLSENLIPAQGFYVDVGAYHPFFFSNTCLLHLMGWRGINIDANPQAIEVFKKIRPNDTNIFSGVTTTPGQLTYHIFDLEGINTFCEDRKVKMIEKGFKHVGTRLIDCQRLESLLELYLEEGQQIHFLNIDIEGKDEEVCLDFNWAKYRPTVVCIEVLADNVEELMSCPIHRCLTENNYVLKSYLDMSALYIHKAQ